MTSPYNYPHL